ncbi:uncharacterized protein LOC113357001 isoform X2 [Papaver somniferum]|uniref:uncharacterized protein LOC113357001 isoform X2 n=1 Tax=Papaver somniferum TaxID=3469 RepID=UPI000E701346|nr:uncharacterized protein LOC113357001 isoform X2 [Papaver somniferum]
MRVEEEPMKKSKTGEDGLESSSGKGGENSDDRFPLSHFKPKKLVRWKTLASKKTFDVSSADVGGKAEKGCEGAKGAPGGSYGKSVPLTRVCKVSSPDTKVEGSGEGGEQNQSEVSTNDGKGYLASLESNPTENIERSPPLNQGSVGGSMFTFPGAACDLLAALDTLSYSSFSSLTVAQMLQVVLMYDPAM